MAHDMKPCGKCDMTGFADKVNRGIFTMAPVDMLCTECGGRGWVPKIVAKTAAEMNN